MKKRVFFLLLLASIFTFTASAHPSRTDANGGHWDSSTGTYHFHHGYPAHQHTDGICPYEFDDQTDHSSGSITSSSITSSVSSESNYTAAYGDGYDAGYAEGYRIGQADAQEVFTGEKQSAINEAYQDGKRDGHAERDLAYTSKRQKFFQYTLIVGGILLVILLIVSSKIQNKMERLRTQCNSLNSELTRKDSTLKHVQQQYNALNSSIQSVRHQNTLLCRQRDELHKRLQHQTLFVHDLANQLTDLHQNAAANEMILALPESTFSVWYEDIHNNQAQQDRIHRALTEHFEIVGKPDLSYSIRSGDHVYHTSLSFCSCPDFQSRLNGHAPCKHIYFLAKSLGYPIEKYLNN